MRRNTAAGREMRRAEEDGRRLRVRRQPDTEPPKRLGTGELVLPDVVLHCASCLALAGFEQREAEASGGAGRSSVGLRSASAPLRRGRAREFRDKNKS
jgi:hypothetical protein